MKTSRLISRLSTLLGLGIISLPLNGAVVLTQLDNLDSNVPTNVDFETFDWSGVPESSINDPYGGGTIARTSVDNDESYAQSFDVDSSFTVASIYTVWRLGSQNGPHSYNVEILEVSDVFAADIDTVITNTLLSETLSTDFSGGGVARFDLSGASQISLAPRAGDAGYAFRIVGQGSNGDRIFGAKGVNFTSGSPYTGGQWYKNGTSSPNNDFAMSLVAIPEPATFALSFGLITAAIVFLRRRLK